MAVLLFGDPLTHLIPQIPYPVEPSKVQEVSDRAVARWNGGDAEHVGLNGLHPGIHHHARHLGLRSRRSSFDGTVRLSDVESMSGLNLNHGVRCDSCSQVLLFLFDAVCGFGWRLTIITLKLIIGARYQCGNCPSVPFSYNLVCCSVAVSESAFPNLKM